MKASKKSAHLIDPDFCPFIDGFFVKSDKQHGKEYEQNPTHYGLIPADAPIWEPMRKGTRVWRNGVEVA